MILGTVKGTVYSTRKMENLKGLKFLLVQPVNGTKKDMLVAADTLGAGIGELVLVTTDHPVCHGPSDPCRCLHCGHRGQPSSHGVRAHSQSDPRSHGFGENCEAKTWKLL